MSNIITEIERARIESSIDYLTELIGKLNKTWWTDLRTQLPKDRNIGELLMLVTSELAEAMEGHRKNLNDDKLLKYKMFDVEIADALIRLFDIGAHLCPKLGLILVDKLVYNLQRSDHKPENRLQENGKKY